MKNIVVIVFMLLSYAFAKAGAEVNTPAAFQKFISHQVADGETLSSIAKKYGVDEKEVVKLNPDARKSLYEGLVLILPSNAAQTTSITQESPKLITHKVKRKETLYSIAKKYEVTQEDIKKYNKHLYSEILRKGDKLRIPTNIAVVETDVEVANPVVQDVTESSGMKQHKVLAKETKYGIARKYGVTIAELEKLNPFIKEGLKEGIEVTVPQRSEADSVVINEDKYAFYEVQKGNTMYSLLRQLKLEADELLALNPGLEDGLKEGMILKVPKNSEGAISVTRQPQLDSGEDVVISTSRKGSLRDSISDFSTKRVVVMLPFGLNRMVADSSTINQDLLRNDRILRVSLDLYSGMLMAVQDAKELGISAEITSYDTEYNLKDGASTNARKVERIVQQNNFSAADAVIGPLLGANINRTASLLAASNIPVISPMSFNVAGGNNIFISRPSQSLLRATMLEYVKMHGAGKNVVIIADSKNQATQSKLKAIFPNAKIVTPRKGDNGYFLYPDDIPSTIDPVRENWVFIETNDVPLISNVTTSLNAQVGLNKVTLFTTNRGSAYDSDEIQHMHLKNLSFHFPSVDREYDYKAAQKFIDAYDKMYGVSPSSYAIRGYDLMYDTLLRLSYAQNLYDAAAAGIETDYIENKFRYGKRSTGGFSNDAVYLLKYKEDLSLEEIPFTNNTNTIDH